MPTTYTGDPTNAATPDVAPEPETAVVCNIPIATEGRTVSSIDQFVKALANQVAWLKKVKAKASAWAGWIWAVRTALGHKRFLFDHLGLPAGRITHWNEDWPFIVGFSGNTTTTGFVGGFGSVDLLGLPLKLNGNLITDINTAGSNLQSAGAAADFAAAKPFLDTAGDALVDAVTYLTAVQGGSAWKVRTVQNSGSAGVNVQPPDSGTVSPRHRYVTFSPGDTLNDYAMIFRRANAAFSDDLSFYLEWQVALEATSMGGKDGIHAGFCEEDAIPNVFGGSAGNYACFTLAHSSANWFARTRGGGSETATDSAVAAETGWTRFRIEFHGGTVADDTTRSVRYYINGTLVATHTTNIPAVTAAHVGPHFSCVNYQGGSSGLTAPLRLGPVQFAQNLYGSDVA